MNEEGPRRARIFEPGTKVRDYVIHGLLGTGGMAEVYDAIDTRTGTAVAIKVLQTRYQSNPKVRERAIQEGQALARLSHENLVRVLDVGLHGDSIFFIAMERLRGRTLASLVQTEGQLPVGVVLTIAQQIADGVHTLHLSNTVHRDLKPANVFVSRIDGAIRAKILDLGAVKVLDKHGLTSEGSTIGTVTYMAPEQTYGERVGFYTDVYAIGLMLFEMLAGVHPGEAQGKRATKQDWVAWQRHQEAPSLKDLRAELPDMLVRLVDQCLRKNGLERAPSGGRLAIELRAIEDVLRRQGRLGPVGLDGWSDEERADPSEVQTKPAHRIAIGGAENDRRLPYASTQETLAPQAQEPDPKAGETKEIASPEPDRSYDTTPDALAAVHTAHGVPPVIERPLPQPQAATAKEATTGLLGVSPVSPLVTEWRQVGPAPNDLKPSGKRRPFTERLNPGVSQDHRSVAAETPQGVALTKPATPTPAPSNKEATERVNRFGSALFLLFGVLLALIAVCIGGVWVWWSRAQSLTPATTSIASGTESTPSAVIVKVEAPPSPKPIEDRAPLPAATASTPPRAAPTIVASSAPSKPPSAHGSKTSEEKRPEATAAPSEKSEPSPNSTPSAQPTSNFWKPNF